MEVPDHTEKVWSPAMDAPPTLSPGAKMSTQRPVLLLGHTESSSELAATVSVASTLAGDRAHESPSLLPVRGSMHVKEFERDWCLRSLAPTALRTQTPFATRAETACDEGFALQRKSDGIPRKWVWRKVTWVPARALLWTTHAPSMGTPKRCQLPAAVTTET